MNETDYLMNIACFLLEINVILNLILRFKSNKDILFHYIKPIWIEDNFDDAIEHNKFSELTKKDKLNIYFWLFIPPFIISILISSNNVIYGINLLGLGFGIYYTIILPVLLVLKSRFHLKIGLRKIIFLVCYCILLSSFLFIGFINSCYCFIKNLRWD